MAGCENPEEALEEERQQTRERVAVIRARGRSPDEEECDVRTSPPPCAAGLNVTLFPDPVRAVVAAYLALSVEQRARFRADQEKHRRPTGPLWVRYEDLIDRC